MVKRRDFALGAGAVVAASLGGTYWLTTRAPADIFAACQTGAVGGDIGGPFTLVNENGELVTDTDVITRPSLLYFGYTYCPDVCPMDVARNAVASDVLSDMGHDVTPVFISIDPERDTPDIVGAFAANMHDRMIGLTGSPEQVAEASRAYKTYYRAQKADGDEFYLVDHSTFTYLVLPKIGFVDFFRREMSPEEMAERTACLVTAAARV
ncbi:MAG: SCO family protein [Pseudomonadota bacterium]